jgi:hypothetical protein
MSPATGGRGTAILVEAKADLWLALTKDGHDYIRDPESKAPFPPLASWRSSDAAYADLTRWGFLILRPPTRHYISLTGVEHSVPDFSSSNEKD